MTGILRVSNEDVLSALNNLKTWSCLTEDNPFAEAFGFTEEEINQLLSKTNFKTNPEKMNLIREWYNGYNARGLDINRNQKEISLYNPWSIANVLSLSDSNKNLKSFWGETASTQLLVNLLPFTTSYFKETFVKLLNDFDNGKHGVEVVVTEDMSYKALKWTDTGALINDSYVWSLLLFSGYLTNKRCC